ncbi:MAG: acyltransferase [Agathobacter sp.]|nr:acyltransferase [Agathobacter sp.]
MHKRIDSLNFIRIIGMTMILLFHAKLMYGFSVGLAWFDDMISIGAIFVTVFFMLSGFGLRKSNQELAIRDFSGVLKYYKKRILSIYPLFLLLTVVALIFQFRVMDSWNETLMRLPVQFTLLHILVGKDMHGFLFNDNCWYISALFVLYLLFPILNECANRLRVRAKVVSCVVLWVVSIGVYFYCVYGTELTFLDYYPNPFLRIPEFMIGMLCADLSEEVGSWMAGNRAIGKVCLANSNWVCTGIVGAMAIFAAIVLTILYPHFKQETNLYGVIVIPCTAVVFLCMANWEWGNRMGGNKLVRWLAGLGLEVYLCQSFATLVLAKVKVDGNVDEMVFMLLTVLFAVVVNTFFTRPIGKIGKARG